jgi:predicted HicB family RNase H-like nuclease
MSIKTYKGFILSISINYSNNLLVGNVINSNLSISISSSTLEELETLFIQAIDSYINTSNPPFYKSFNGRLPYRTTPSTHKKIYLAAKLEGLSINKWIDKTLKSYIESNN